MNYIKHCMAVLVLILGAASATASGPEGPVRIQDLTGRQALRPMRGVPDMRFPAAKAEPTTPIPADAPASVPQDVISRFAADGLRICGNVIFSSGTDRRGIWSVDTAGQFAPVHPSWIQRGITLSHDGLYQVFYVTYDPDDYYQRNPFYNWMAYDMETWTPVQVPKKRLPGDDFPCVLCTDGDAVYGLQEINSIYRFGRFDLATGTWSRIADCEGMWYGCSFAPDGYIYYIDDKADLYRLTPSTGEAAKVGPTGCDRNDYMSDMVADRKTGRLYRTCMNNSRQGCLYEIDRATGAATRLALFPGREQMIGLYIPGQEDGRLPASVSGLAVSFPAGSLSGTVGFRCPTTLNDGSVGTGNLTYTITVNGVPAKSGQSAFGQEMSLPLAVDSTRTYTIGVSVANAQGRSRSERKTIFIGNDTPTTPTVTATYADGRFRVAWSPSTAANGGCLDLAKLSYTVTRYPDATVVAEAIADTALIDPVPEPETFVRYRYSVVASCNGATSGTAYSAYVPLGSYRPPYLEPFNSQEAFDGFTVENLGDGSSTWRFGKISFNTVTTLAQVGSSPDTTMSAWLISPPVRLQGGRLYRISCDMAAYGPKRWDNARVEFAMGTSPSAAAMALLVGAPLEVTNDGLVIPQAYEWYVTAPADGVYHVGAHCISPKNAFTLYLDNLGVSKPVEATPDSVTGLRADLNMVGWRPSVTLSFNVPTGTIGGNPISSVRRIAIVRDGKELANFATRDAGTKITWTDNNVFAGYDYRWDVVCYNDSGQGRRASAFLNLNDPSLAPAPVTGVTAVETKDTYVITSWTRPTTDNAGNAIDNTKLTYRLWRPTSETSEEGLLIPEGDTVYNFRVGDFQQLLRASITASNVFGDSRKSPLPSIPVGKSYTLPYRESFADGEASTLIYGDWDEYDNSFGVEDADGTDGFIMALASEPGDSLIFYTGKISLEGATRPRLSFSLYNFSYEENGNVDLDNNRLDVLVREVGSDEWTTLLSNSVAELCPDASPLTGWHRLHAGLDAFRGKKVQLAFKAKVVNYQGTAIDALAVEEELDHNLSVTGLSAPDSAYFNRPFTLTATVENRGSKEAAGYSVEFYRNGSEQPFRTVRAAALAPDGSAQVSVEDSLGVADAEVRYRAVVSYEPDTFDADNASAVVKVARKYNSRPVPTGLHGDAADGVVTLEWNAPEINGGYSGYNGTETFETCPSWAHEEAGDWTFVDVDRKGIGTFYVPTALGSIKLNIPGSPLLSKRSFIVIEQGWFGMDRDFSNFPAHSGKKFLGSLSPGDGSAVDDWLISPLLSGSAQTVRLYARSTLSDYPDCFEMLYSASGRNVGDFVSVQTQNSIPADWDVYTFAVPEGARYFAIRHKGTGGSMLMLDDISFTPAPMLVSGYRLYRDDVPAASKPVQGIAYTDHTCPEGRHTYRVTALYNDGSESAPSNAHDVQNGVASIPAGVMVEGGRGYIAIAGAEGMRVSVFSAAGLRCFSAVPEGNIRIPLQPGVYLVGVGHGTAKVIVL